MSHSNKLPFRNILFPICTLFCFSVHSQQHEMWGVTSKGGEYGGGVIYQSNLNDHFVKTNYTFKVENMGAQPVQTQLSPGPNDKFYGLTASGGLNNLGVLFSYDPETNSYQVKYHFDGETGQGPRGGLLLASNEKHYGLASGGERGQGILFEYDAATDNYKVLHHFNNSIGTSPDFSLIEGVDNKLYGLTFGGGYHGDGTIFEFDIESNETNFLLHFNDTTTGSAPVAPLLFAENGRIYGITFQRSSQGKSAFFEFDFEMDTISKITYLEEEITGYTSDGALIQISENELLGVTRTGGSFDDGTIIKYFIESDSLVKVHDFNSELTGNFPHGSLLQSSNGTIYGVARYGGIHNEGTIFELHEDEIAKLYDFEQKSSGGLPCGLIEHENGIFYGLTYRGGKSGSGTIFSYSPETAEFIKKLDLNITPQGGSPETAMINVNGIFFGVTPKGGLNEDGSLFAFDPQNNDNEVMISFDYWETGQNPQGPLLYAENNMIYGTTSSGGANEYGALYEFNPADSSIQVLYHFNSTNKTPVSGLVEFETGKLIGSTRETIYEFDITNNSMTKLTDLASEISGLIPKGNLLIKEDKVYGHTEFNGENNWGALFELDLSNNELSGLHQFNTETGAKPLGSLRLIGNILYGLASFGGSSGWGVLYSYDLENNQYQNVIDFNYSNGGEPSGFQILGDSLFIVTTQEGGDEGKGTITIHNLNDGSTYVHLNFGGPYGQTPLSDVTIIEVDKLHQRIDFTKIGSLTYGHTPITLVASSTSDLAIVFESSNTEVATVNNAQLVISGAGESTITASQSGNDQYSATQVQQILQVEKAELIAQSNNKTKHLGEPNPEFTITFDGFANGDTEADITVPEIFCEADELSEIGEYEITLSGGASNNYYFVYVNGILTIIEPLGIKFDNLTLLPFPNPTKNQFELNLTPSNNREIFLYDLAGKQIMHWESDITHFNISNLKPGIYQLTLREGNKTLQGRIIKE